MEIKLLYTSVEYPQSQIPNPQSPSFIINMFLGLVEYLKFKIFLILFSFKLFNRHKSLETLEYPKYKLLFGLQKGLIDKFRLGNKSYEY